MSRFRTIETSPPLAALPGLTFVTVKSAHLRGRADLTLFVPPLPETATDLPIVILLHGVYGSHWAWALKGNAHLTAQRLITTGQIRPAILAMPADGLWGDGSGYVPHAGRNYEKWIVEEVPALVVEVTPHASDRSPVFLSGLSMGGYGALRLGAKYGHLFSGISAHSAITRWEELTDFVEEDISQIAVPSNEKAVIDLLVTQQDQLPPIRFDCGREDPLLSGNRLLHQQLSAAGIPHTYEEFAGGHEWEYWTTHLENTLRFFL